MSDNYNANIYLTTKDLNDIEDRIENITEECQEKIFGKNDSTYSGTNFQIQTSRVENGELTKIDGQIEQETTKGINFLPITLPSTTTLNGITASYDSSTGYITISGTATATTNIYWDFNSVQLPSTTYVQYENNFSSVNAQLLFYSNTTTYLGGLTFNGLNRIYNLSSSLGGKTINRVVLNVASGTSVNGRFRPMIHQQSTIQPFVFYDADYASPTPEHPQPINITTGRQVVSVCGKNLFDKNNLQELKGYFSAGQTTIASNAVNYTFYISCQPNTTYTITITSGTGTFNFGYTETFPAINTQVYGITTTKTLTTGANGHYLVCRYYHSNNATKTKQEILDSIQIEEGNTYNIDLSNKNLFSDTLRQGVTVYNTGVWENSNTRITSTNWIQLKAGTYTISAKTTNTGNRYLQVSNITFDTSGNFYNISGVSGLWKRLPFTFTTPIDLNWKCNISFNDSASLTPSDVYDIQIEEGNSATDFVEHKSIYLGKIGNYKDYIFRNTTENPLYDSNLEEGQWYIHKEIGRVVLNGSETWSFINSSLQSTNELPSDIQTISSNTNAYSNNFKYKYYSSGITALIQDGEFGWNSSKKITFKISSLTTKQQYLDWLSTHNTEVYYILNTPTNTLIEDEELINQLESIQLITGLNNINVSSPYLSGVIGIHKYFSNALRNIKVGDDLSGKTLYLSFPRTSYENILDEDTTDRIFIITDINSRISYRYYSGSNIKGIAVFHGVFSLFLGKYLYACYTTSINPYLNLVRFKLPKDFGVVTNIDINSPFYQYVKIYDESIIPNYTKHTWVDNEQLTMQKIDNIEQGVRNIGHYYEKPNGWVQEKEWLGEGTISSITNYGVGIKTISYQDLNRWYNNLDLIDFNDLNDITIWNAVNDISQIEWNSESDEEWVDNFVINVYELTTEDDNTLITEDNNVIEVTISERV